MVTGFFIIFEGQFDVGDMVEIPPHTGIIEELGLRMTRLRNYLGQQVIIPNRNIAAVGNYSKGAQEAFIDVALSSPETSQRAKDTIRRLGEEVARQFEGIVMKVPEAPEAISLATDEHFVRMQLAIWPQQQWVVEQQLVPRIREALKREGLEIPGDRVAVFYHPREERPAPVWRRIRSRRKKAPSKSQGKAT